MNLLWITDPHLNFLRPAGASRAFGESLCSEHVFDAVVLSGDIAEAPSLCPLLAEFARGVAPRPVYFVLGNHDYYFGSFESVQRELRAGLGERNLTWLDEAGVVLLDDETALVGHQGWFDARLGNAAKSRVIMSDFELIADLRQHYRSQLNWVAGEREPLLDALAALGTRAAEAAQPSLRAALRARRTVVFVTHFPPFEGACWHEGALSDAHWLPWFTCHAMGQMLVAEARERPNRRVLVLCGHTHSPGVCDPAPNLRVLTGRAEYGSPGVSALLTTPVHAWPANGIELREPHAGDWSAILTLANRSVEAVAGAGTQEQWLRNRQKGSPLRRDFVALEAGTVVGYAALEAEFAQVEHGFRLFVVTLPERRDQIGSLLLAKLEAELAELGAAQAWFIEYARDREFLAFLQRRGFVPRRSFQLDDGVECSVLSKPLSAPAP